jgi:hypothetical protein
MAEMTKAERTRPPFKDPALSLVANVNALFHSAADKKSSRAFSPTTIRELGNRGIQSLIRPSEGARRQTDRKLL